MSDTEDEDMRRAIALSMRETSTASSKPTPTIIDLTSDDEDDDLDAPVHTKVSKPLNEPVRKKDDHASLKPLQSSLATLAGEDGDGPKKGLLSSDTKQELVPDNVSKIPSTSIASSMFGIDRAKMEADRLARVQQQKKKHDELLAGSNDSKVLQDSRKRKASEPLTRNHDDHQVKAKCSTPSQPAEVDVESPNSTSLSALLSGSRNGNSSLMQGFLSPTHGKAVSVTGAQPLKATTPLESRNEDIAPNRDNHSLESHRPGAGVDASRSSKTLDEQGDRTKTTPSTQGSRSLEIREPSLGIDVTRPSQPAIQRTHLEVLSFKQQQTLQASGIQYPNGVVKRTWVKGCPQEEDTIKIEEVFQKDDLELAVLSTFMVDPDWVSTKLLDKTKIIWVLSARDEAEKQNLQHGAPKNYRFCFPSLDGNINMMHSKLQLLAHPNHLRVVVPSANLVPYDWGESGVIENLCFLIDLPRFAEGKTTDAGETSEFGKELLRFVRAMGLDPKVMKSMNRFDFSRTSHIRFVHSIGGSHSGEDWKLTGYCGLGTAVQSLGLGTDDNLCIDFVVRNSYLHFPAEDRTVLTALNTSSVGKIDENVVKAIYLAAQGDDGSTEYGWRASKPSRGKAATETDAERKLSDGLQDCFRIYFPTKETVADSKGGIGAADTICFQSKWYDSNNFPRHLMRDAKSRRGVLMHNKMIFVQPGNPHKQGRAWAYVGSANLSESAWGRLVKDRTTKEPKLNCRNWECGVVFPVPEDARGSGIQDGLSKDSGVDDQGSPSLEIFRGYVPVPMIVPGERYGTKRPWFYQG